MNRLRIMIVDDEPPARMALRALLAEQPDMELVAELADGSAAVDAISRWRPQIVFLDVQMPGLTGLEVVERLDPGRRPVIVFVTAYDEHAIKAFDVCALDYLVKPFSDARFLQALDRARAAVLLGESREVAERLHRLLAHVETTRSGPRLMFKVGADRHLVPPKELLWIEAQDDCVKIAVEGRVLCVRETLQEIEARLDPTLFVRVHRSFIVNRDAIRRISPGQNGELVLFVTDGAKIPVSRSRRGALSSILE